MSKLTWIKKRVRMYELFDWAIEFGTPTTRRSIIVCAIEDYNWMNKDV